MRLTQHCVTWALVLSSALSVSAKIEDWKDVQGNTFKAEPAEALGPFALFRTASGSGRRLPWRALSHADCVRFDAQAVEDKPAAARWSDANGKLTGRLRGVVSEYADVKFVTADLTTRPEPQLLVVFYVDNAVSPSWDMIGKSIPLYNALQEKRPGQIGAVQFGSNHGEQVHNDMALKMKSPWLLVDYAEQGRITPLFRLSPARDEFGLMLFSRDGVPIIAVNNPDEAAIKQFFVDVEALLILLQPGNPAGWPDRAHHLAARQAANHSQDSAGPVLVGNPLVPRLLKQAGIFRVEAKIEVGADGKVAAVTVKEDGSIPAAQIPNLAKPLQRSAVFVPAVDHGQFVAGTYDYLLEVPR